MKKRYTEEQILRVLREGESGVGTRDLCQKYNISEQTFYRWRSKFGRIQNSNAKRLRELEEENTRLKRIVADLTLDNAMLRDAKRTR